MARLNSLVAASTAMRAALPSDLKLIGVHAALEPMSMQHVEQLQRAASEGELWNLHYTTVPALDECSDYVAQALANREAGEQLPFVVRRVHDQQIVGSTRFYVISASNRNMSIGHTWYSKSAQRTGINTECKLMLLTQAFEKAGCISVQWHTHHENFPSQAAIERLGARKEGVLRNHAITDDGSLRHTHCYSMLDTEWPAAKARLSLRLAGK